MLKILDIAIDLGCKVNTVTGNLNNRYVSLEARWNDFMISQSYRGVDSLEALCGDDYTQGSCCCGR